MRIPYTQWMYSFLYFIHTTHVIHVHDKQMYMCVYCMCVFVRTCMRENENMSLFFVPSYWFKMKRKRSRKKNYIHSEQASKHIYTATETGMKIFYFILTRAFTTNTTKGLKRNENAQIQNENKKSTNTERKRETEGVKEWSKRSATKLSHIE